MTDRPDPAAILLTAPEAARMLAVSPRTLWSLTQRGEIPAVRIGRSVRYSAETLRRWVAEAEAGQGGDR